MTPFEKAFHDVVLGDDDTPLLPYVGAGNAALASLNIYRRNVLQSIALHLAATFPVCEALMGERTFRSLCRPFIGQQPPVDGVLSRYGEQFPEFLHGDEVMSHIPYIADVARLEWAMHAAAWAKSDAAFDLAQLQAYTPEQQGMLKAHFHGSVALVDSAYAVDDIWEFHQHADAPPVDVHAAQCVLVWRDGLQVRRQVLLPALAAFYKALLAGNALNDALHAALQHDETLDPSQLMLHLLTHNVLVGMSCDA